MTPPPNTRSPIPNPPGLFIVFEGLDGSGTSTQAAMLRERLSREGTTAYLTAEPSTGPVGALIRQALQHRVVFSQDPHTDEQQMAYLFAADRFDHLHNDVDGVLRQRASGAVVVCARYVWSSFAYNCRTDEDVERVARLNRGFPAPDLTVFVDVPVEVSLERIGRRQFTGEKYENREKLTLTRAMYERAMREFPCETLVLDGEQPPAALHARVAEAVQALLAARRGEP